MPASHKIPTVTGKLSRLMAQKGHNLTAAVVIYKDHNNYVCWYGSEELELSEAIGTL